MRIIGLLMILLIGISASLQADEAAEGFFPYPYENFQLDNGLKVILVPQKGSGLIAYYTIVRTGSRDEWEPGKSGFAHFFEHMMFKGTPKYPGGMFDKEMNGMGANFNAYTTSDYTAYHMVIASANLEKAIDLESDRFQNLAYPEEEFRTEAGAVYGEYRKGRVNPFMVAYEAIRNKAFDRHTYKHTTIGFEADIKNMPKMYDYSRSFFQRYYRPENCIVLVSGDFESSSLKLMLADAYGNWKPGYVAPKIKPEPPQTAERRIKVTYEGKTLPLFWIGYKGKAFDPADKEVVAARLLGELAFGEISDIYKELVIRQDMASFIAGDFDYARDPELYSIYGRVKDEANMPTILARIDETVEVFKTEKVSDKALDNLKRRLRYSFLMNLDTPDNIGDRLASYLALTGNIESVNQLFDTMESITPDDILNTARTFLKNERRTVLTLKGDR